MNANLTAVRQREIAARLARAVAALEDAAKLEKSPGLILAITDAKALYADATHRYAAAALAAA